MIKHIVMFKLAEEAEGKTKAENLAYALDFLKGFEEIIPTLKGFEAVVNSQEAPESNYELALVCDFDDMQGLDEYQVHPRHKEFGAFITKVRMDRACIDYEY